MDFTLEQKEWASKRIAECMAERKRLMAKERKKYNVFASESYLKQMWRVAGQLNILKEIKEATVKERQN
jgi:muconolactone delta-isomerase